MANFSVNQVRHLYVAKGYVDGSTKTALTDVGDIDVKKVENDLFFTYKGADGVIHSDLIPLNKIDYAKAISAFDMATVLKKVKVTLDSSINSGAPIAGKDYVLGINFKNFFSSGDASQYYKDAAVHATSAMASDVKKFYKAMVAELNACFSREDGATATTNPYLTFSAGTAGSEDGIYIEEKPQAWKLGTMKARRIMFDVLPGTVFDGTDDVVWGTVADATPAKYVEDTDSSSSTYQEMIPNSAVVVGTNAIGNGQSIADLEWFCMGERGDQYRMKGWPNYIHTEYLVNSSNEYNLIEFHYAFTDTGVNSYRTEKELTIAVPKGASSAANTLINAIIGKINTAAGTTLIATL